MIHSRVKVVSLTVVLLLVLSLGTSGTVAAQTAGNVPTANETFAIQQGDDCYEVSALGNGSETVEEFYAYNPDFDYSSEGTTHLQENQVSNLFVYNGSEGYSLVFLHDKHGDGPNASTTTFTITGLPKDGEWAVEDDSYGNTTDDNFDHYGTRSEIDWVWAEDRTDGGAFRGLLVEENVTVTVDPAFNERADRWGDWPYSGDDANKIEAWKLLDHGGDTVTTLAMEENVTVTASTCDQDPTASLSVGKSAVNTNQSVTFDASGSTDDTGIVEYRWDFDGDGTVEETTESATVTSSYESSGEYNATVTVVDATGNTATTSTTVTVTTDDSDTTPPTAVLDAPGETGIDTSVTLNASASTDNDEIVTYRWDVDGDGTIDQTTSTASVTTSYGTEGDYEAAVTVVDTAGNEDTANTTIAVTGDDSDSSSSTPVLDAPVKTIVDKAITFDWSSLPEIVQISEFRWDFDGDGSIDRETAEASVTKTFQEAGTHEVTVTLMDEAGNTYSVSATVTVLEADKDTESPIAKLDAPAETTTGTEVTLDASASSDNAAIGEYHWDFDGDGNVDRKTSAPTTTTSYETKGDYETSVTVIDSGGNTDTASANVTVTARDSTKDTEPPTATIEVPDEVDVNQSFTVTATNITDASGIAHLCWYSDGKTGPDGKTMTLSFETSGTHTVSLRVKDTAGNDQKITRVVTVVPTDESDSSSDDAKTGDTNDSDDASDTDTSTEDGDSSDSTDSSTATESDDSDNSSDSNDTTDSSKSDTSDDTDDSNSTPSSTDVDSTDATETGTPDISVTAVHVGTERIAVGESMDVTATVKNDGDASGSHTVSLSATEPGETESIVSKSTAVPLEADETRNVTLTTSFDEPGEYDIHVGSQTATITVSEVETVTESPTETEPSDDTVTSDTADQNDSTDEDSSATASSMPGLGIASGVVAMLGGAAALYRRV